MSNRYSYLDSITELVHVHMRMLERYAKTKTDMIVRAKNRRRKRKSKGQSSHSDEDDKNDSEEDGKDAPKRIQAERQFDFNRFEAKYLNQSCVDTFLFFLSHYRELNSQQIKRALSFLHRIFVKKGVEVLLFRMDMVDLFHSMLTDREGFSSSHPMRKDVEQFINYFTGKLTRKLLCSPPLYIEVRIADWTKASSLI